MEEMMAKVWDFLKNFANTNIKVVKIVALVAIAVSLIALAFVAYKITDKEDEHKEPQIEDTATIIQSIKPCGKLVLYKSKTEDFVIKKTKDTSLFSTTEHSIAYVLSCTCYYYIDLDSINYEVNDSVVIITMPEVKYASNSHQSKFIEDDPEYWAENLKKIQGINKEAEAKIKKRFDTQENREKANRHAENVVRAIFEGMGLQITFKRELHKKKE